MTNKSPPTRKRQRIFYGWYVIALTGVAGVFAGTTSQAFFGVFLKPIEDETGWSRTAISGAITVATFVGGGISVFVGRYADRYGPRMLMTGGTVLYGVGYLSMLVVSQVWQLYIAFFLARLASLQFLAGVVPRTTAVNWFRRMRGRALGFQTMAMPLGGAALASVAGVMIASGVPWRTALAIFGFAALVLLVVPTLLLMRRQPEDMGLLPDGDDQPSDAASAHVQQRHRGAEASVTLKQSLHTKAMWFVVCGSLLQTLASGGIAFHMPAYFEESGMSTQIAATGASVFLLGGALSATLWGFLAERFDERLLVVGATFAAMLLAVAGRFVSEPIGALTFACLFGATIRGEGALVMMMLAAYYGRGHFGSISGFVNGFTMMGLGIGPTLYAWVFEARGSYHAVFFTSATLLAIAVLLMFLAKNPYRTRSMAAG